MERVYDMPRCDKTIVVLPSARERPPYEVDCDRSKDERIMNPTVIDRVMMQAHVPYGTAIQALARHSWEPAEAIIALTYNKPQ